jgi:hypothetical protein
VIVTVVPETLQEAAIGRLLDCSVATQMGVEVKAAFRVKLHLVPDIVQVPAKFLAADWFICPVGLRFPEESLHQS